MSYVNRDTTSYLFLHARQLIYHNLIIPIKFEELKIYRKEFKVNLKKKKKEKKPLILFEMLAPPL